MTTKNNTKYESEWFGPEWDEWYKEHTPYKQYLEKELLGKTNDNTRRVL